MKEESYPFAEMQSVYSTAPADHAEIFGNAKLEYINEILILGKGHKSNALA